MSSAKEASVTTTPPPFETASMKAGTTPVQPTGAEPHACLGLNNCAGQDRYGVTGPDGDNPNSCAGQGFCATTAAHSCHTNNDCAGQGGCGLYGWGPELAVPGQNSCQSMGSCATPINAERFVTDGQHRATSVWALARTAFEIAYAKKHAAAPVSSAGPAPAPFSSTGPTYKWISDTGCMTACGSSGLSGAGSCS